MKTIEVRTRTREQFVNITAQVQDAVAALGIAEGVVTVFVPHTTCGVTINECADPDVASDILRQLGAMVPLRQPFYQHGEGNSAAHVKASLVGSSIQAIVAEGQLALGTWQGIFLCEFDGPRTRRVWVR